MLCRTLTVWPHNAVYICSLLIVTHVNIQPCQTLIPMAGTIKRLLLIAYCEIS